ncbi:hypothetical protein M3Y96_01193500 [Aphelenchoides besseyi]|nr:hypothetical protein M3Y96_01193500 [Aphelenchoides besseyi]
MTNNTQATTSSNAGIERCEKLPTNLERDSAYHGFITQTMAETNVRKAGDYVVWGEEKENAFAFHLTVRVDVERVKHYRLVSAIRDGQLKWSIDGMVKPPDLWFVEIPELLKSLKKTEGICTANEQIPTKMTRAAKRPHDLIRNRNIRITSKHRVGEGNFCVITEGQLNWAPGITRQVAIKAFKELASDATFDQIIKEQKDMLREIRIMSTLSHVNVTKTHDDTSDDRRTKTKYKTLQSRGQSITTHSNFSPKDSVADHSRQRKVELGEAKNGKKPKTLGQSNKTLD